jgi:RHS repeat-associated protein
MERLRYDAENRLTQADQYASGDYAGAVVFQYDGLGRMRLHTTYDSTGFMLGQVGYIYDGMRVIQERNGTTTPQVSYTRGTDLSGTLERAGGIGGLLARSDVYSSGNFTRHNYYHADGNGNITYLETSAQGLAASYRYDPFGNTVTLSGTLANANVYRFSSKEFVPNAINYPVGEGFYYYGYRFYWPGLQRWLNRDPIHEFGFLKLKGRKMGFHENAELNLYAFVGNGPIYRVDPLGLSHRLGGLPGGKCCNKTSSNEWWIDDGVWKKLPAGKCTGTWDDCDGFTCDGGFYAVSDLDSHSCDSGTRCSKWGQDDRWTPNGSGPSSTAPGPAYPGDNPGRGGPVGNPYPGGGTWGDWP